jgi:hypothetical protein|tara:strand:+ start:3501 stop:3773 length:273 start_codon:yes stop_codon:yes gene_type:complete
MNIKDWKQFSDLVDKHNKKLWENSNKHNKKMQEEWRKSCKEQEEQREAFAKSIGITYMPTFHFLAPYSEPITMSKTEVNFWEWKANKLKL